MMNNVNFIVITSFFAFLSGFGFLDGQTIAEKKAGIGGGPSDDLTPEMKSTLSQVNNDIAKLHNELHTLYMQADKLYQKNAPAEFYEPILTKITRIKEQINALEGNWQHMAVSGAREAGYALWNQPDTTIGQLVNDFGSYHYLYMAPPDISKMKISLDSNLPIPRSSWDEVLELVLNQSGIGIKQLNPYVRELYFLRNDLSNPKLITSHRGDLELFPATDRVVFVLSPEASEIKRIWVFLEKFTNPTTTALQLIGREIVVVGNVAEVKDLLKIYDFVSTHRGDKEYKAVRVTKVDAEEMARILSALFESINEEPGEGPPPSLQPKEPPRPPRNKQSGPAPAPQGPPGERPGQGRPPYAEQRRGPSPVYGTSSLRVIALNNIAQALFLVGTKEEIRKAEEIIRQVEGQVGDARKKEVFWYTVKHSDAEELAQILARIYLLMIRTGAHQHDFNDELISPEQLAMEQAATVQDKIVEAVEAIPKIPLGVINDTGFLSSANYLSNPEDKRKPRPPPNQGRDNFLVDLKTGAIIMVIEADLISEMRDLIKRLDVPKRMVQIEVMLVEQVVTNQTDIGLNLLKLGSLASQTNATSLLYNTGIIPGITDFIISRKAHSNIPAFDITYHFLISRDDVRINASPSVLTMNETEAVIEFEEEIPVSVGTFIVPNAGTATLQESLARGRYGIKIDVIPTIHMHDKDAPYDDGIDYITLDSNVKFETVTSNIDNKPHVLRRTLTNQARIADGQTVIIGGFRRKDTQDVVQSVPFLGDIPGLGKLFSTTAMRDSSTETFLFLTAKIASEPLDDLEAIKMEEMARRPGDLPYFMQALREARETEEHSYLNQTLQLLFGREPERYIDKEACERDGRCEYDGR